MIVTYERRVSAEPARAAISRLFVDDTVEVPRGAAPTACPGVYDIDAEGLASL